MQQTWLPFLYKLAIKLGMQSGYDGAYVVALVVGVGIIGNAAKQHFPEESNVGGNMEKTSIFGKVGKVLLYVILAVIAFLWIYSF